MLLTIDVEARTAKLGEAVFKEKWAIFFGVLARARLADPYLWVTPDSVAQVGSWRHQKVENIGRQIATFIDGRLKGELALGVEYPARGKTTRWRLGAAVEAVRVVPTDPALWSWLEDAHGGRTRNDAPPASFTTDQEPVVDQLAMLVDALILVASGAPAEALERLGPSEEDAREALRSSDGLRLPFYAWESLLRARAANRLDDDLTLEEFTRGRGGHGVHALRSVQARLWSLRALHEMFIDTEEPYQHLTRLITQLEESGDIGALAVALNSLGLLQKARNRPDLAEESHLRAFALAGISGDFVMLEAILYNIAACRAHRLSNLGGPPDRSVLRLIDVCVRFGDHFNIGQDRIISEVDAVLWSVRAGELARADKYMACIQPRLAKTTSEMDLAYYALACAEVEIARWGLYGDPARLTRAAARLREAASRNRLLKDPYLPLEIQAAIRRVQRWPEGCELP